MKLAISNIAWASTDRRRAYEMMRDCAVQGLEIAPGLAFPEETDPFEPSAVAVRSFEGEIAEFGLQLVSMQSLLFGQSGARLFGSAIEVATFERAMEKAITLAARLGIPNLVFGSPLNRAYPEGMSQEEVSARAADIFGRLGDEAVAAGTVIAMEPNPAAYGTNFLNSVDETADFVAELNHPAITLNFDMGALSMNDEVGQAGAIVTKAVGRISHVHISEPQLAPAPQSSALTAAMMQILLASGYRHWFSVEMRLPPTDALETLCSSLNKAVDAMTEAGMRTNAR